ncbi:MAG: LPS export ABC transporter periplasmic protein LptC [Thermodesulfobacteriota bacterium]
MKKLAKLVLPAFIIISLAGLIILVSLYYRTNSVKKELTFTEDKDVGVKIDDLNYSNTRDGRTVWKLKAREATRFKSSESLILNGIKLLFYAKDGGAFTMKADDGTFNEAKKLLLASGGVVVFSPEGYTLKTDNIRYETASGYITSKDHVLISTKSMDVEGVGFDVNIESGNMYIKDKVRAVIREERFDG